MRVGHVEQKRTCKPSGRGGSAFLFSRREPALRVPEGRSCAPVCEDGLTRARKRGGAQVRGVVAAGSPPWIVSAARPPWSESSWTIDRDFAVVSGVLSQKSGSWGKVLEPPVVLLRVFPFRFAAFSAPFFRVFRSVFRDSFRSVFRESCIGLSWLIFWWSRVRVGGVGVVGIALGGDLGKLLEARSAGDKARDLV